MKRIVSLLIVLAMAMLAGCMAGCASVSQAIGGYESAAVKGLQAADDNVIATTTAAICATPFSAAVRNPQIIPALKVLCLPGGAGASAATLLDSVPTAKAVSPVAK